MAGPVQVTLLRYHVGGGSRTVSVGGYEVPSRRYWTRWARWVGVHHAKQRGGYELSTGVIVLPQPPFRIVLPAYPLCVDWLRTFEC